MNEKEEKKEVEADEFSSEDHVKSSLGYLNTAREEAIDAMKRASEEGTIESRAVITMGSSIVENLCEAIEAARALLGLPPETIYDDEEDD